MIDIATYKLTKIAGVTDDAFDEDGDLELKYKLEPSESIQRCLIKASDVTEDCLTVSEKPDAVLVNYNNMGYARLRFDDASKECWI